jgi:hypothetical protein
MTNPVTVLNEVRKERSPDPKLVKAAEELLAKTKSGEIAAIAFVVEYKRTEGPMFGTRYELGEYADVSRVIGGVRVLEARLLRLVNDDP